MKQAFKLMMITITLIVSAAQTSQAKSTLNVLAIGDMKLQVKMSNIQGRATSFIKDENGKILSRKRVKIGEEVNLIYDVSDLTDGVYFLTLKDESKSQTVPFRLIGDEIKVQSEEFKKTFFPKLVKEEDEMLVKLLSDESNDLHIDIRSSNGDHLYYERIEGKIGLIGKRFKFNPGSYLVSISSNDYSETTPITFE
ncbi:hypothetical protein [Ekhidna sp.]